MKMTKHPDPDGTFSLLDGKGNVIARGIPEGDADARIAAEAASDVAKDKPAKPAGKESPGPVRARDGKAGARDGSLCRRGNPDENVSPQPGFR